VHELAGEVLDARQCIEERVQFFAADIADTLAPCGDVVPRRGAEAAVRSAGDWDLVVFDFLHELAEGEKLVATYGCEARILSALRDELLVACAHSLAGSFDAGGLMGRGEPHRLSGVRELSEVQLELHGIG
jgi:hypothetical protein